MTTALVTHPASLTHVTPPGHPEQVARLEYVLAALEAERFADLRRETAPLVADDDLLRCHPLDYIQLIRDSVPDSGWRPLDADTHMSPGSLDASLRGAGANVKAAELVITGEAANAFAAVRPPGHHAERATAMGFCFFGNVSIAAKNALDHHGLGRVAILDFDVHHGNGTQDLVEEDARIFFASSHQMPLYPGTGAAHETGAHDNVLNVPLAPGTGSSGFRRAWQDQILPACADFRPDMVFVSAGFDAHRADPLANLELTEDDFAWVTRAICDLADDTADGRVVSTLEGGYDLSALAASTAAHVAVLMERGA
ncbi:MAG: histone deacetylase family protein [Pseudomonadota bacterium]